MASRPYSSRRRPRPTESGLSKVRPVGMPAAENPLHMGLYAPAESGYPELVHKTITFLGKHGIDTYPLDIAQSVVYGHRDVRTAQSIINREGRTFPEKLGACLGRALKTTGNAHSPGLANVHEPYIIPNPGDSNDDRLMVAHRLGYTDRMPITPHFKIHRAARANVGRVLTKDVGLQLEQLDRWGPLSIVLPVCALRHPDDREAARDLQTSMGGIALGVRTVDLGPVDHVRGPLELNFLPPVAMQ